jgi:Putative peptidoglycan binding domain
VLPVGEIPELLATQLTFRVSRLASQFLSMCIRAIDYCPPVDITFGEFLRAVLTADADLIPDDALNYREAWIEAFAKRQIYPANVPSLSEDALRWKAPSQALPPEPHLSFAQLRFDGDPGRTAGQDEMRRQAEAFGQLAADPRYRAEFGLANQDDPRLDGDTVSLPIVESVRSSRRVGPSGQVVFDLVAEITQRREVSSKGPGQPGFDFFGGATVLLGPQGQVRFVIRKSVLDKSRLEAQRRFIAGHGAAFFGQGPADTRLPQASLLLKLHDVTRPALRASAGSLALGRGLADSPEAVVARRYLLVKEQREPFVPLLKACLQSCGLASNLEASDLYDEVTAKCIGQLQMAHGAVVDGVVGPATWSLVGAILRERGTQPPDTSTAPRWIAGLLRNDPATTRLQTLDSTGVVDMTEYSFGVLSESQKSGLGTLLQALIQDPDIADLRWSAYMLATVKHECANTWQPIVEFGKGAGRAYGVPVAVADQDGTIIRNTYYGRGFVQLTWRENYLSLGQSIGLGRGLEINPDLALDPSIAYRIMSYGMRHGTFTGKSLAKYINKDGVDYLNARRIINGLDRAAVIQGYAKRFETMLLAYA